MGVGRYSNRTEPERQTAIKCSCSSMLDAQVKRGSPAGRHVGISARHTGHWGARPLAAKECNHESRHVLQ